MKNKKRLLLCMCAAFMSLSLPLGAAACDKPQATPSNGSENYAEEGVYYCDVDGKEYLLHLSGTTFTLFAAEEHIGTYAFKDGNLNMTFAADKTQNVATYSEADGTVTLEIDGVTYKFLKKVEYTVTYDVAGGSAIAAAKVINGKKAAQPDAPTKDGFDFVGWYVDAEFKTPFNFNAPIVGDTTVYARFVADTFAQAEYDVKLIVDGETLETKQTIGGKLYNLPAPEKEGATFLGWWTSDFDDAEKLTAKYDDQAIKANTALYAVWAGETPAVSATAKAISWTSAGTNKTYKVKITGPSGVVKEETLGETNYAFDFATLDAGEYTVEVSVDDVVGKAYLNNKALAKVSNFEVMDPSVLVFNAVENAERYIISVDCGNDLHQHTEFDNGNATYFNFANCDMQAGGIKFTVKAVANGYVSSVSDVFTYSRDLAAVTGLRVDAANDTVVWDRVAGAVSYEVEISDGTNTTKVNVGAQTSYALGAYTGALTIKVTPKTMGYNAPEAASVEYAKTKIAAPQNVVVTGKTVTWNEVANATKYIVKVNGVDTEVTGTTYTLPDLASGDTYEVSVQAVAAEVANSSVFTKAITVKTAAISGVKYNAGTLSWNTVVGATNGYKVKVNGVDAGTTTATSFDVTLTKAGKNTVSVAWINNNEVESEAVSVEVYAYEITFDTGTAAPIAPIYKAVGDKVKWPDANAFAGYEFAGWYNTPGGFADNGKKFDGNVFDYNGNLRLYASLDGKMYQAKLVVKSEEGTLDETSVDVKFGEAFELPTPVPADGTKVFVGWNTQANGSGVVYTGENGEGKFAWNSPEEVSLYPIWATGLSFKEMSDGTYAVFKGAEINKVKQVTIPATYNNKLVSSVEDFSDCKNLEVINIPDSIVNVTLGSDGPDGAASAFRNCINLTEINVYEAKPGQTYEKFYSSVDGLLIYDNEYNGKELKFVPNARTGKLTIPEGVETIPTGLFKKSLLTEVEVPASVKQIDAQAFAYSGLKEVIFLKATDTCAEAAGLSLGYRAFYGSTNLTRIVLPARLNKLEVDTAAEQAEIFEGNAYLESIEVDTTSKTGFHSVNGALCKGTTLIKAPATLTDTYTIPLGVEKIDTHAFLNTSITKLVVPGWVKEIAPEAFYGAAISEIDFQGEEGDADLTIGTSAFYDAPLTKLVLPANLKTLKAGAFYRHMRLTEVTVNATTGLNFESRVFCKPEGTNPTNWVTKLNIGPKTEQLDISGVFGASVSEVEIDPLNTVYQKDEKNVIYSKDGKQLLYFPSALKSTETAPYEIKAGVQKIAAGVFQNKMGVEYIKIPSTVNDIGQDAFSGAKILKKVDFETPAAGVELNIGKYAFADCSGLITINLPTSTRKIEEYAFSRATALRSIVIPEGTTMVGADAFNAAGALETVSLPSTLVSLAFDKDGVLTSFKDCVSLKNLTIASDNATYAAVDNVLYGKTEGVVRTLIYVPIAAQGDKTATVNIPETVNLVKEEAFYKNEGIKTINFPKAPDNVVLEKSAFYYMRNVEKVVLPSGLREIPQYCMAYSPKLQHVYIPNTVTTLNNHAFNDCSSLNKVEFQDGNDEVEFTLADAKNESYGAFQYCTSLREIEFPARTVKIGSNNFYNARSLRKVTIPDNVTEIGTKAFYTVDSGTGVQTLIWNPETSKLTTIGESAFENANLSSLTIPARVTSIGKRAFYGNMTMSSLTFAALPATAEGETESALTIGESAFEFATSLLGTLNIPARVTSIGARAFAVTTKMTGVNFAANSTLASIGNSAFAASGLTSFAFPETSAETFELGDTLFENCRALKSVTFSKDIDNVDNLLTMCPGLSSVTLADGTDYFVLDTENSIIKSNDGKVLYFVYGEIKDQSFSVPEGIEKIAPNAFKGQSSVKSISLPASLMEIGDAAFSSCINLTSVEFRKDQDGARKLATIGNNAFEYCQALTSVEVPATVTSLGTKAFYNCHKLESVTLPAAMTKLPEYTFYGCSSLKTTYTVNAEGAKAGTAGKVTLPAGITEMGAYAFAESGVVDVTLPNALTKLAVQNYTTKTGSSTSSNYLWYGYQFENCTSLTTVTVPATLTTFGKYVFNGCSALTTMYVVDAEGNKTGEQDVITMPNALELIEGYAFQGSGIKEVKLPKGFKYLAYAAGATKGPDKGTASYAFKDCKSLAKINLENLVRIGGYAFQGAGLESVNVTKTTNYVGGSAFENNTSLKSVVWDVRKHSTTENGGTKIFAGCTSLKTVEMFNTVAGSSKYVASNMFTDCTSLTTVKRIEEDGTVTGKDNEAIVGVHYTGMFSNCTSLTKVILRDVSSKGVKNYLYNSVFLGCSSLAVIEGTDELVQTGTTTFAGTAIKSISLLGLKGATFGAALFQNCAQLESVTLSDEITKITYDAFYGCTSLTSLKLPEKLSIIDKRAFADTGLTTLHLPASVNAIMPDVEGIFASPNLTSITVDPKNTSYEVVNGLVIDVASSTIVGVMGGLAGEVVIPEGVNLGSGSFLGVNKVTKIVIPEGITEIPQSAFSGCEGLKEVVIPDTVTQIGFKAFYGCTSIEEIYIPDSVTSFGSYVRTSWSEGRIFEGTTSLRSVRLPATMDTLTEDFFYGAGFKTYEIPAHIKHIQAGAFDYSALESITVPATVETISGNYVFGHSETLKSVTFNNELTTITDYMFCRSTALESVTFAHPELITSIAQQAFGYSGLRTFEIPENVKSLGYASFGWMENLETITLNDGLEIIEDYVFYGTPKLQSISIPDSVVSIGEGIIGDSGIVSAKLPASFTKIPYQTFSGCVNLKNFTLGENIVAIGEEAFSGCTSLSLKIPANVMVIEAGAFDGWTEAQTISFDCTSYEAYCGWGAGVFGELKANVTFSDDKVTQ